LLRHTTPKTTKRPKTTQEKTHAPPYNDYDCPAPLLPRLYRYCIRSPIHTLALSFVTMLYTPCTQNRLRQQSPLSILSPSSLVSTVQFAEYASHLLPYGIRYSVLATMLNLLPFSWRVVWVSRFQELAKSQGGVLWNPYDNSIDLINNVMIDSW
jgi:hypothetical protein